MHFHNVFNRNSVTLRKIIHRKLEIKTTDMSRDREVCLLGGGATSRVARIAPECFEIECCQFVTQTLCVAKRRTKLEQKSKRFNVYSTGCPEEAYNDVIYFFFVLLFRDNITDTKFIE